MKRPNQHDVLHFYFGTGTNWMQNMQKKTLNCLKFASFNYGFCGN